MFPSLIIPKHITNAEKNKRESRLKQIEERIKEVKKALEESPDLKTVLENNNPDDLQCKISFDLLVEPVIVHEPICNIVHTYNKEAIDKIIENKKECPHCRKPFTRKDIRYNVDILTKIENAIAALKNEEKLTADIQSNKELPVKFTYSSLDYTNTQIKDSDKHQLALGSAKLIKLPDKLNLLIMPCMDASTGERIHPRESINNALHIAASQGIEHLAFPLIFASIAGIFYSQDFLYRIQANGIPESQLMAEDIIASAIDCNKNLGWPVKKISFYDYNSTHFKDASSVIKTFSEASEVDFSEGDYNPSSIANIPSSSDKKCSIQIKTGNIIAAHQEEKFTLCLHSNTDSSNIGLFPTLKDVFSSYNLQNISQFFLSDSGNKTSTALPFNNPNRCNDFTNRLQAYRLDNLCEVDMPYGSAIYTPVNNDNNLRTHGIDGIIHSIVTKQQSDDPIFVGDIENSCRNIARLIVANGFTHIAIPLFCGDNLRERVRVNLDLLYATKCRPSGTISFTQYIAELIIRTTIDELGKHINDKQEITLYFVERDSYDFALAWKFLGQTLTRKCESKRWKIKVEIHSKKDILFMHSHTNNQNAKNAICNPFHAEHHFERGKGISGYICFNASDGNAINLYISDCWKKVCNGNLELTIQPNQQLKHMQGKDIFFSSLNAKGNKDLMANLPKFQQIEQYLAKTNLHLQTNEQDDNRVHGTIYQEDETYDNTIGSTAQITTLTNADSASVDMEGMTQDADIHNINAPTPEQANIPQPEIFTFFGLLSRIFSWLSDKFNKVMSYFGFSTNTNLQIIPAQQATTPQNVSTQNPSLAHSSASLLPSFSASTTTNTSPFAAPRMFSLLKRGFIPWFANQRYDMNTYPKGSAFCTGSGDLSTSSKIHGLIHTTVATAGVGGNPITIQELQSSIRTSVELAHENGYRSLAFPLVCGGIFTQRIFDGLQDQRYYRNADDPKLKEMIATVIIKTAIEANTNLKLDLFFVDNNGDYPSFKIAYNYFPQPNKSNLVHIKTCSIFDVYSNYPHNGAVGVNAIINPYNINIVDTLGDAFSANRCSGLTGLIIKKVKNSNQIQQYITQQWQELYKELQPQPQPQPQRTQSTQFRATP